MMTTTASALPYIRYPLRHAQTRLLRIDSIDQDGTLTCSLRVIDLDGKTPSYYAISYFWGQKPTTMSEILVDGLAVSIRPSHLTMLKGILRFLNDRAIEHPYIWVDAICIDQNNLTERAEQVQQMNLVYGKADSVLIWLGQECPDSDLSMTVMQWLGRRVLDEEASVSGFPIPSLAELETQCKEQFNISSQELNLLYHMTQEETSTTYTMSYHHRIWRAWQNIASREWFSRVWTLQELLLARRALFICGNKHINWQSLQLMTKNPVNAERQEDFDPHEQEIFTSQYTNIYGLMLDKERADSIVNELYELKFSLSYIMISSARRKLEATDIQDHVYGKLGLVRPEIKNGIKVDYKLAPELIFMMALRLSCFNDSDHAFSSTRYIVDLWEFAAAGPPSTETPSWLPFRLGQTLFYKHLSSFTGNCERACENLRILHDARCRVDNNIITLDVFRVDTIKIVLRSPFRYPEIYDDPRLPSSDNLMDGYRETLSEAVSNWLEAIEGLLHVALQGPSRQQARETFLRDLFWTFDGSTSIIDLEENFRWIRRYALQHRQTQDVGQAIVATVGSNPIDQRWLGSYLACLLSRSSTSYCYTESGRFGRCVSQNVQSGDTVCMIPHGKRLHIFRSVDGTDIHKRITTAWFCGWSQGEAAIEADTGRLPHTTLRVA